MGVLGRYPALAHIGLAFHHQAPGQAVREHRPIIRAAGASPYPIDDNQTSTALPQEVRCRCVPLLFDPLLVEIEPASREDGCAGQPNKKPPHLPQTHSPTECNLYERSEKARRTASA